jgi:hypothetical protein
LSAADTSAHDMMEQAPAAIAVFDNKMRYLAVSRRFLSDISWGTPPRSLIYETFPDIPSRWREVHFRVLAGEVAASEEDVLRAGTAASNGYGG